MREADQWSGCSARVSRPAMATDNMTEDGKRFDDECKARLSYNRESGRTNSAGLFS